MIVTKSLAIFAADERGAVLPFWGVSLTVLLGLVAMSFDLGRIAVTQTDLQSFADNVALAAAGELDGQPDAITRATSAAAAMIADSQTYGDGGTALAGAQDYALLFLSDLPAEDVDPVTAVTTDPAEALFAHVDVTQKTVPLTFGAAFAALSGNDPIDSTVGATAIAGFTAYACDITPLMMCLPSGWSADAKVGQMIELRSGGSGSGTWLPGAFGFLDPSKFLIDEEGPCEGETGGNLDRCLLGAAGPITQCFSQRGVDIEPGQKTGNYEAALNTRFDIYNSSMNGKKNDPRFAPAPNVIKGIVPNGGGQCIGNNEALSPNTIGLPRDTCFGDGAGVPNTCNALNGGAGLRFGTGDWDRHAYFSTNYAPFDGTVPAPIQTWLSANAANPATPTRFEIYRAEIAVTGDILTGDTSGNGSDGSPIAESGRPICNVQTNPEVDYKRRVVSVAAIDCTAEGVSGAKTGVPYKEIVSMFLTEPASNDGSGNSFTIWAEVIGSASGPGAGGSDAAGIFRDGVQLYR